MPTITLPAQIKSVLQWRYSDDVAGLTDKQLLVWALRHYVKDDVEAYERAHSTAIQDAQATKATNDATRVTAADADAAAIQDAKDAVSASAATAIEGIA